MHETYEEQGLTVLAVSREPKSIIETFIEETEADHPIMIDAGNGGGEYGVTGIPAAFLIDGDGEIAWAGHPSGLSNEKIEEVLKTARLMPDLPSSMKTIAKAIEKAKFGDAIKKLTKDIDGGKYEGEELEIATKTRDGLVNRGETSLKKANAALEAKDVVTAFNRFEKLEDQFKGHAIADQAKAGLKSINSDKALKTELKAALKWAEIKKEIDGLAPKKALKIIKPLLSRKYEDTKAGKLAQKKAKELERILK